jgi:CBS domain-containing protein
MERTGDLDPAGAMARGLGMSPGSEQLMMPIGSLPPRAPVVVPPDATVAQVASSMRDADTSAALVSDEPAGIVTHRDLSTRVLAAGRPLDTPVSAVMSRPLQTFDHGMPVFEALHRMLELGVHHLPITRDGNVVAILRDTDLLRHQARGPLPLLDRIDNLHDLDDAPTDYADEVALIADTLFAGGLGVVQIGRVLAALSGALVGRLLVLSERELGPPPCRYAWMALGSEGRMEQVLLSDQDNALVYEERVDGADRYFRALAERVVGGLVRAGFPPCPGGYMATNWCLPLADWRSLFAGWINVPEPQPLLEAQVFFDFRRVHGELSLDSLDRLLLAAGRSQACLHGLARACLSFRPPLGPFGRVRGEDGVVDLKAGGIAAIVMLARLYALAGGKTPQPTLDRLRAATEAGTLSRAGGEILGESFRLLTRLRLREQLRSVAACEKLGNDVRLRDLSPLERRRLAEALRAVRKQQEATSLRYPGAAIA